MRAAMMLVLLACIPAPAVRAVPCSGAEQLMLSIGKELSAGNVSGAEQILSEMDSTHRECPVAILAHARAPKRAARQSKPKIFLCDMRNSLRVKPGLTPTMRVSCWHEVKFREQMFLRRWRWRRTRT